MRVQELVEHLESADVIPQPSGFVSVRAKILNVLPPQELGTSKLYLGTDTRCCAVGDSYTSLGQVTLQIYNNGVRCSMFGNVLWRLFFKNSKWWLYGGNLWKIAREDTYRVFDKSPHLEYFVYEHGTLTVKILSGATAIYNSEVEK